MRETSISVFIVGVLLFCRLCRYRVLSLSVFVSSQRRSKKPNQWISSSLDVSIAGENVPSDIANDVSKHSNQQQHIVIVGGGVGGLAVAARIAASCDRCNVKVSILEKNANVGGRCGSFWVDAIPNSNTEKIRHERGPSLLLLPSIYRQLFVETTGKSPEEYGLTIIPCIPAYQVVFEDGDCISVGFPAEVAFSDMTVRQQQEQSRRKMDSYEPNGAKKWDDYMTITAAYLDCGLPNFIEERLDLASFPNFLVQSLRDSAKAWPLRPHSDLLESIFESNKMKSLASFQDLYVGLEPYKNSKLVAGGVLQSTAPAVFGLLSAIELHPTNQKAGVFAPIGGFQAVTDAMERLAKDLGVGVYCNTTVTSIDNDGVYWQRDGEEQIRGFLPANFIIVNADLPYAKKSLIGNNVIKELQEITMSPTPPEERYDWDDNFSFSSGVISFHWSLSTSLDKLTTHNVFLIAASQAEAEASWQVLRSKTGTPFQLNSPFNFYVHRPKATDPTATPPNTDSIMVLVPCQTLLRDEECAMLPRREAIEKYQSQFSDEMVSQVKRAVLHRMSAVRGLLEIEQHIVNEVIDTPATWADQFNLGAGTPFALSHGFAQLSVTRPSPQSSGLPNVVYCGASTRPGNGVPLVLVGAELVATLAVERIKQLKKWGRSRLFG